MTQEQQVVAAGRPSLDNTQIVLFEEARQSTDIVIQNNNSNTKVSKQTRKKAVDIQEHLLPVTSIAESYGTQLDIQHVENSQGLSTPIVIQRQITDGKNILSPPKRTLFIVKVIKEILSPFSLVLIIAGFLSILDVIIERTEASIPNIFLGLILFVVVFFNAFVTLFQERKGEKIIESFQELQKNSCWVIRDGTLQKVDSEELVNGDIVKISTGDLIPADLRCISSSGLKVDNSTLTGESDPQTRTVDNIAANPLEATNLLFFGTTVLEGLGFGIVIRTGNKTVMGNIANLAGGQKEKKTPIRREIDRFVFILGTIAIVCCIIFFCVCMSFGFTWFQSFLFCIGVITGCIPAGLIATVTTCLSISAARLKEVNIVVKRLDHVETLGSITVVCSDKTGTLTQNKMTVVEAWLDSAINVIQYNDNLSSSDSSIPVTQDLSTEDLLQRACSLCSSATFLEDEANMNTPIMKRECLGDASEIALIKYVESRGKASLKSNRKAYPELYCIPFSSKNKWMLTINELSNNDEQALLLMKGAPERIANLCSKILVSGVEHNMNEYWRNNFQDTYEFFASKGCRVLAFAQTTISKSQVPSGDIENVRDLVANNLTFLGMVALTDPPKAGVTEAVAKCKGANIQVVMVTGDHPITAKAIAKQVGIIEPNALMLDEMDEQNYGSEAEAVVLHGEQIDQLTDEDWKGIMKKKQLVFARTSPQQKLLIVSKFQEYGHIVAVTGDGTNDSPALKKADIGVAMNLSGSAVSKEAAALILLDDNFASIVNGIQEGRLIFDNLKKSLVYTVSHNLPEMTSFVAFMFFGIPVPMTGLQMICLDLGTEVASSICLAYENAENDLMSIPPRKKSSALVGVPELIFCYLVSGLIESLGGIFCFIFTFAFYGVPPRYLWAARQGNYFQNTSSTPLFIEETGITLSGVDQNNILVAAQTSYFLCIVLCQIVNMYTCRTRRDFIFTFPPFSNLYIYLGMVVAVALSVFLIYCPFINDAIFGFRPVTIDSWLYPIPWMFMVLLVNELRKMLVKHLKMENLYW